MKRDRYTQWFHLQAFVLCLSLVCQFAPAQAEYIFWRGTTSNQWEDAANWSPAQLPGPSDIAVMNSVTVNPVISQSTVLAGFQITGGTLTIAAGVIVKLHGLTEIYAGTLVNNGTLRHESETGGQVNADFLIYDSGNMVNNGTAIFRSRSNFYLVGNFASVTLENNVGGVIELYGNLAGFIISDAGTRTIINKGSIFFRGWGPLLQFDDISNMVFINSGRIVAAGQGIKNASGSQITNESCGVIDLRGTATYANGTGITNNAGLILTDGALTNSGTFLNTGVVRAASFGAYTNQGLQINQSADNQMFEYGSANAFTVTGIFKDSSSVNTAGVFTAPNSFTPNSPQARVYAQAGNGTCTFLVPFLLDPSVLPVTLVSFGVTQEGFQANLIWNTATERNSRHFEVEHSIDAKHWQPVGLVPAQGESSQRHTYHYTHTNLEPGSHYYRLKMVDWDDSYAYSRVVSAKVSGMGTSAGNFYPNPTRGSAALDMHVNQAGTWILSATDLTGRTLYRETVRLGAGQNHLSLPRTGSGLRLVKLTHGGETIVRKIVFE